MNDSLQGVHATTQRRLHFVARGSRPFDLQIGGDAVHQHLHGDRDQQHAHQTLEGNERALTELGEIQGAAGLDVPAAMDAVLRERGLA